MVKYRHYASSFLQAEVANILEHLFYRPQRKAFDTLHININSSILIAYHCELNDLKGTHMIYKWASVVDMQVIHVKSY